MEWFRMMKEQKAGENQYSGLEQQLNDLFFLHSIQYLGQDGIKGAMGEKITVQLIKYLMSDSE